ncbi:hypothetical protein SAY86_027461 [Trapa natans]|uniref:S-adenosyl-L-methionine-dependent methyltransferase superfamily protein n=1 Tax=Trapa natans TaxID=22666 RepID=A0AAN7KTV9_TRANT|nr:hypothetical protein SAY86_027461 [Trapa natans]
MPKPPNPLAKFGACRGFGKFFFIVGTFGIFFSIATMWKFYSLSISGTFCSNGGGSDSRETLDAVIQKLKLEIEEIANTPSGRSSSSANYIVFLADILGLVESARSSLGSGAGGRRSGGGDAVEYFLIEEIRKYVKVKPNRLGKQNFMGANGTFTSIGHACFAMKEELERYMDYDVGDVCNDDWRLGQRLMVHGCDPLPRRRCFARAPKLYRRPLPISKSMWRLPDDRNVRWSHYRCKNFTCLASNTTRKGFFKCADCFNLTTHEWPRWVKPVYIDQISNMTVDFLVPEVLAIKPGEIRIGLDFSIGTGTFAARMREFDVTIVSATINLGAPFSETIALRGLVPLYLSINQRLPFFDNTLDLIHTTSFFCSKEDLEDYLGAFKMLRYRKHKWVVIPKVDKDDKEVFFSAVLEKPPRPFR